MKHYLTNRTSNFGFDLFDMMDDFFAPVFTTNNRYMSTTKNTYYLSTFRGLIGKIYRSP